MINRVVTRVGDLGKSLRNVVAKRTEQLTHLRAGLPHAGAGRPTSRHSNADAVAAGRPSAGSQEPIYERIDDSKYENRAALRAQIDLPRASTPEPLYATIDEAHVPRLLQSVESLVSSPGRPQVAETLTPIYENLRDRATAISSGDRDYEDLSRAYENLLAAAAHLREAGELDEDEYMEMRSHADRAQRDAAGSGPELQPNIDEAHVPRLLQSVESLVSSPGRPQVAETLTPVYENLRDCATAISSGDRDYEDLSRAYENLLAAAAHLREAGELDEDEYMEMRSHADRAQRDAAGSGPELQPNPAYAATVAGPLADSEEHIYESLDDLRRSAATGTNASASQEPLYERIGDSPNHGYEEVGSLLDAVAALTSPSAPTKVAEAVQPIYEEIQDCTSAISKGDGDYEDMSRIYVNLLAVLESLNQRGDLDDETYTDMRLYQNQLEILAESADRVGTTQNSS